MTAQWKHPESHEVITRQSIEGLVHVVRNSPRERQRAAARQQLERIGVKLHTIIRHLERKLESGYEVLEVTPNPAREDTWVAWLEQYESACDTLSLIEWQGVGNDASRVTQRRGVVDQEARAA